MPRTRDNMLEEFQRKERQRERKRKQRQQKNKNGKGKSNVRAGGSGGERPADDRRRQQRAPNRENTDKPQPTTDLRK